MPSFATIYWALPPGSFHDANIQHEHALMNDASRLLAALTDDVGARIREVSWHTSAGDFTLSRSTFRVDRVRRTPEGLLLLEVEGQYVGRHPASSGVYLEWVDVLIENRTEVGQRGRPTLAGFLVSRSDSSGAPVKSLPFDPPLSLVFPLPGVAFPANGTGELLLPLSSYQRLIHFYDAAGGDPSYASGHWMRMLYFSATAITTLGFGDITPVSTEARTWVTAQAILGVVVIGLFLNAVAVGRRRRRDARDECA
jgi:hypothetical protein